MQNYELFYFYKNYHQMMEEVNHIEKMNHLNIKRRDDSESNQEEFSEVVLKKSNCSQCKSQSLFQKNKVMPLSKDGIKKEKKEKSETEGVSEIILKKNNLSFCKSQSLFQKNKVMPLSKDGIKNEEKKSFCLSCDQFLILIHKINMNICFRVIFFILVLIFLISCLMQAIKIQINIEYGEMIEKYCLIGLAITFIIEMINWKNHNKFWLILDFICIVSGGAGFLVENDEALRYLKAIRCLKILFFIKMFENLNQTSKIFIYSWGRVAKLSIPCLIIIFLISVANLFTLAKYQYEKCRDPVNKERNSNWTVYEGEVFLCGNTRPCPMVDGIQYECLNPIDYNVQPNPKQLDNMHQGYGLLIYSNIAKAFFSTFKQIFITGSEKTINLYKQPFSPEIFIVQYILFTYLISIMYFNVFYGVLFLQRNRLKNKDSSQISSMAVSEMVFSKNTFVFSNTQKERHISRALSSIYLSKLKKNDKITENSNNQEKIEQTKGVREENIFAAVEQISIKTQTQSQSGHSLSESESSFWNFYKNLRVLFAFLGCINLSLNFEGQSKQFECVRRWIEIFFYFLLVVEIIALLIYEKCMKKKKTGIYFLIQLFLGSLYTAGLIYDGFVSSSLEDFALGERLLSKIYRSFLFLRIFSTLASNQHCLIHSNQLLIKIAKTIYMARHFFIVWLLVVITLSLMGFHLHHGRHQITYSNWYDRFNFEGIYPAIIFTLLTVFNEEWDTLMLKEYSQSGFSIIVWQFLTIIIGFMMCSKYLMLLFAAYFDSIMKKNLIPSQKQISQKTIQDNKVNQIEPSDQYETDNNENQEPDFSQVCCRKFKGALKNILKHRVFGSIKFVVIVIVQYTMFMTHPQADPSSNIFKIVRILSYCCTLFFLFEFIGKLVVEGLWVQRNSMKQKLHFLLKGIILLVEILMFSPVEKYYLYYRIEKVRVLRVIEIFIIRYQQDWEMNILLNSISHLIVKKLRPVIFLILAYFFFGIILTSFYKNDYYYCDNSFKHASIITKQDCLNWGGDWVQHTLNFSNPLLSVEYAIIGSSMGGWLFLMVDAMDMNGEGMNQSINANLHIQIFYLILFFCGNIIFLNFFISFTLNCYKNIKQQETGQAQLTDNERVWLRVKILLRKLQPIEKQIEPTNLFRKYAFRFIRHKAFVIIKSILFFLPILIFSMLTIDGKIKLQNQTLWRYLTIVVIIQNTLYMLAYGLKKIIPPLIHLSVSIIVQFLLIFAELTKSTQNYLNTILIVLIFINTFKIIQEIKFARKMFNTIFTILPQTKNIVLCMLTLLYFYTICGMQLFSFLKFGKQLDQYNQNFTTAPYAFFSLFKFSIMESSIQQIIDSSKSFAPNFICNQIANYEQFLKIGQTGCGNPVSASVFYLSFHFFYNILLMSIFLAFIVDAYANVLKEESLSLTKYLFKQVQELWSEKDPKGTGLIPYRQFWLLTKKLVDLYENENIKFEGNQDVIQKKIIFLSKLNLTVYEDNSRGLCFEFSQFLQKMTKNYLEKSGQRTLQDGKVDPIARKWVQQKKKNHLKKTDFKSSMVNSLILLKSGLKAWRHKTTKILPLNYKQLIGVKQ